MVHISNCPRIDGSVGRHVEGVIFILVGYSSIQYIGMSTRILRGTDTVVFVEFRW